jgi:hypothetical protein
MTNVKAQGDEPLFCDVDLLATKHAYFLPLPAGMPDEISLMFEAK